MVILKAESCLFEGIYHVSTSWGISVENYSLENIAVGSH